MERLGGLIALGLRSVLCLAAMACASDPVDDAEQLSVSLVIQTADRAWLTLDARVTFAPTEEYEQQSPTERKLFVTDSMRAALAHSAGQRTSTLILDNASILEPDAQRYFDRLVMGFMHENAIDVTAAERYMQGVSDPSTDSSLDVGATTRAEPLE